MRNLLAAAFLSVVAIPVAAADLHMGDRSVDPAVPHRNAAEVSPGIKLANGSFTWEQDDLATGGRVLGLTMRRVYRSDMDFDGPLGQGWTGEYFQAAWRDPGTGDILWHDARGFLHTFVQRNGAFRAPPGVYASASWDAAAEKVSLRRADGTVLEFTSGGQLGSVTDRHGNAVSCQYDAAYQLTFVYDDRGYAWEFAYDASGRISQLIDHVWETESRAPRVVEYGYDAAGRLASIKLPETSRYNDASNNRVTWEYAYDSSGRLYSITAPNEVASGGPSRVELEYDSTGRVVSFRDGDASAWHYLRYTLDPNERPLVRHVDPRDVRSDYTLDRFGRPLKQEQYTGFWIVNHDDPLDHDFVAQTGPKLRGTDPARFVTRYRYNRGHELTRVDHPAGDCEEFTYPDPVKLARGFATEVAGSVIALDGAEWVPDDFAGGYVRLGSSLAEFEFYEVAGNTEDTLTVVAVDLNAQGWADGAKFVVFTENPDQLAAGNLLEHRRVSSDAGQADIVRSWTYEPYFQQVRSETSARGFTTAYEYAFDASGDPADGDLTFKRSPPVTVLLPDGTSETVNYETAYTWNSYGQLTGTTDAEGFVEVRHYYVSGDSQGFLEDIVRDFGGLELTERFEYDKSGVLTGQYSPRAFEPGTTADDFKISWEVNELAQKWHESGHVVAGGERVDVFRYFDATGHETRTWREYVASDGSAPPTPGDVNDPDSFSKAGGAMVATWVESARTFDLAGRMLSETTDAVAGTPVETTTWAFEYDAIGNRTARVSPLLNRTSWIYDERTLPWKRVEGAGSAVEGAFEFDYDLNGKLAAERTPLGNETLHSHDGHGRETSIVDPAGHASAYSYDADDNLVSTQRLDGAVTLLEQTDYAYDEIDRCNLAQRIARDSAGANIDSGTEDTRSTLDGRGLVIASSDGPGRVTTFAFDGAGRLVARTDALGNQVEMTLDAEGNATLVSYAEENQATGSFESAAWAADYDTLGLVVAIRDRRHQGPGFDTEVNYEWDGWGRLVSESDPVGAVVSYAYDLRSRPTDRVETGDILLSTSTDYGWDRDDRLASAGTGQDPIRLLTVFAHDARNRVTNLTRPDSSGVAIDYDADSNLINRTDETGTNVTQSFDARGLLIGRDIDQSGGTVGVTAEAYDYDGAGRLVLCESYESSELLARNEWSWNSLGKAESHTQTLGDGNGGELGEWTTTVQYDKHASSVSITYSDAASLSVARDVLSRLVEITDVGPGLALAHCLWAGPDRLVQRDSGNGVSTSCIYEPGNAGPIARITHSRDGEVLLGSDRFHDVRGLPVRERRDHDGGTGRALTFDGLRRLVQAQVGAALAGTAFSDPTDPSDFGMLRNFGLDEAGNRVGGAGVVDATDSQATIHGYAYGLAGNSTNQYAIAGDYLTSADIAGRTINDEAVGASYAWDYRGYLAMACDSAGFQSPLRRLVYDALGRRVLEEESNANGLLHRTVLVYGPDGDRPIEEVRLDAAGTEVGRVQYAVGPTAAGEGVVAERSAGDWHFHHEDQDGSLIGLTDEEGRRVAEFDYLMYGTPVRRGILLDIAGSEVDAVEEDTPVTGLTRITLSAGAPEAGALLGRELAISIPGALADQYRTAAVIANGPDTVEVADADGLIADALLNYGVGFIVHAARLGTGTPNWTYDGQSDTSTFEVADANFDPWLVGGMLTPDVSRQAYLEIIEVDPNGDWLRVWGDATGTSDSTDHYRVLPAVGLSEETGLEADMEGRYLWRGYRHDSAPQLSGAWTNRTGLYGIHGRNYDPRIGRPLTPGDDWRNEYHFAPWGTLEGISLPTAGPAICGTALPNPACPAQPAGRPEFHYAGPGLRGWFE